MCPRRLRDVPPPQFSPILTSKPRQTATARQASCRAHLTGSIAHQGNVVGAPKLLITVPPGLGRESGLCQVRWEFQYPAPQQSLLAEARGGMPRFVARGIPFSLFISRSANRSTFGTRSRSTPSAARRSDPARFRKPAVLKQLRIGIEQIQLGWAVQDLPGKAVEPQCRPNFGMGQAAGFFQNDDGAVFSTGKNDLAFPGD